MAINLKLEYGGTVLCSLPVELTKKGTHVFAILSNQAPNDQLAHMWNQLRRCVSGTAMIDSTANRTLRILIQADSAADILEGDFLVVRNLTVEVLKNG